MFKFLPAAALLATLPATTTAQDTSDDIESSFTIDAPEVVELGWGWSLSRNEAVPTECVLFEVQGSEAQTSNIKISEIRDTFALEKEMNISASVSVKGVGYKVSGKASFAKKSKISTNSVTFLINAEVMNSARFAAPTRAGGYPTAAVRLTNRARDLALRDIDLFKNVCGEGYVSATINGARSYLLATTKTSSQEDRATVRAEVEGEGWGVKAKAAMSGSENSKTENFQRDMTFFQQGGSATQSSTTVTAALPSNADEAIERIKALSLAASEAGKLLEIQVTPYQMLANFPRDEDLLADEEEQEEIAGAASAFTALYQDIAEALADPDGYSVPTVTCDEDCSVTLQPLAGNTNAIRMLEDMQDIAVLEQRKLQLGAQACISAEEDCSFNESALRSPYALRASMPLPTPEATLTDYDTQAVQEDADGDGNVTAAEKTAAEKEQAELEDLKTRGAPDLRDHYTIHLRDPASGRCGYGADTPGCVTNAELRDWHARAGLTSAIVPDSGAAKTALEGCATYDASKAVDEGDPGNDVLQVIWFAPRTGVFFRTDGTLICPDD
ncbi:MAG: hypothetical protein AAF754_18040 [Pseudomonadota bacterium]